MTFQDQLSLSGNPFGRESPSIAPPVRAALAEVMRSLGLGTPLIVVAGPAGSGKTLVLNMVERALREEGQTVQRLEPGDYGDTLEQRSDVLLVDDAESADQAVLQTHVSPADEKPAASVVLACRPSFATRFGGIDGAVFVKLSRLCLAGAKNSVAGCARDAGPPDPSAPDALDAPAVGPAGSSPVPSAIRGPGVVVAASDRIAQLGFEHVTEAITPEGIPEAPEDNSDKRQSAGERNVVTDDLRLAAASETRAEQAKPPAARRPRELIAAALVLAAVVFPLLLFGKLGEVKPVEAIAAGESRNLVAAPSKTNPLNAMGKVAAAELPRPVILALITPSPLRVLSIAKEQRVAAKALPAAAKGERIAGKRAIVSGSDSRGTKLATLPKQAASVGRSRAETKTVKTTAEPPQVAGNSRRANAVRDKAPAGTAARAPKTQPTSSAASRGSLSRIAEAETAQPPDALSRDQIARLLRDLSERVGFAPAEYSALQACVFGKVGAGPVEADVFRSLVRRCVL